MGAYEQHRRAHHYHVPNAVFWRTQVQRQACNLQQFLYLIQALRCWWVAVWVAMWERSSACHVGAA